MRSWCRERGALWGLLLMVLVAACSSSSNDDAGVTHDAAVTQPDGARSHDAARTSDAARESRAADHAAPDASHASDGGGDASFSGLCLDCIENKCMPSGRSCEDDATCGMWLDCATSCFTGDASTSCLDACDTTYPAAASLYDPVYACICTGCTAGCPMLNACSHGLDAGP